MKSYRLRALMLLGSGMLALAVPGCSVLSDLLGNLLPTG